VEDLYAYAVLDASEETKYGARDDVPPAEVLSSAGVYTI